MGNESNAPDSAQDASARLTQFVKANKEKNQLVVTRRWSLSLSAN